MAASVIFFGVPRGGSSVCSDVIAQLTSAHGYTSIDIETNYYNQGVSINAIPDEVFDSLEVNSHYYGPFRSIPNRLLEIPLSAFKKILVIRDPRDCVVSSYYANKYVHTVFRSGLTLNQMQVGREVGEINEFAIAESFSYKDIFDRLIKLTSRNSDILVFRYEDIFYNSASWIEYIISTLNLSIPQDTLNKVIANIDMLPYSEDPKKHHRQGTPFDHLRKLKPATVEMISKILQDAILWFDYRPRVINFTGYRTSNDSPLSTGLNSAFALVNELSRENGYRIDEINHLRQALDEIFNRMPPRDVAQS